MSSCTPFSIISACVMLVCAAIMQAVQGYPDALSVGFLILGVTSVIHHSRLDEWWKQDVWRALDYIAIVTFFIISSVHFRDKWLWSITCLLVTCVASCIWSGVVDMQHIPATHAIIHVLICSCIVFLMLERCQT